MWKSACLAVGLLSLLLTPSDRADCEGTVVFEGTVLSVGEVPGISCGVMAVYQLAKYRVEKVYSGTLDVREVVVDHLACDRAVLDGISPEVRVVVIARKSKAISQRWNAEGIRTPQDEVPVFYIAERIARVGRDR